MSLTAAQPIVYMIDRQSAAMASMRPLLEASGHPVMQVEDADSFSHDVLSRRTVRTCDALILDLDAGEPDLYRLLNLVMHKRNRPKIVLMAGSDAPIGDMDSFTQDRLHVLRHPATPSQLMDVLDADS
ncbi:hypothetical protein [uncultured Algimonas sp.]|uniref:hypothetical protein n=1 Tax=uncultured Algimonas sp. TaxID=1547920 RepID=UPI00261C0D2A|nr:hypothetical protein [uncultured Algimonas sp.]